MLSCCCCLTLMVHCSAIWLYNVRKLSQVQIYCEAAILLSASLSLSVREKAQKLYWSKTDVI